MNLEELVAVVAATAGLTQPQARSAVKQTFQTILTEVTAGGRVTVVGFGAFYSTHRRSRMGRNPKTGEAVKIQASNVPVFKAGKWFKGAVKTGELPEASSEAIKKGAVKKVKTSTKKAPQKNNSPSKVKQKCTKRTRR